MEDALVSSGAAEERHFTSSNRGNRTCTKFKLQNAIFKDILQYVYRETILINY